MRSLATPSSATEREADPRIISWFLAPALVGLSALTAVSALLVAVVHLRDRFSLDYVSGAWMALARYVNDGTLYPPLYDGQRFGGTRFMPVYFVLHAGLARLTGEYVASGKALSLIVTLLLLAVLFWIIRRLGCPLFLSLALASTPLLTNVGLLAATTIRGNALAVLFQVSAVGLAAGEKRRGTILAGVLCALAIFTKVSAIWAPVAILVFLYLNDRSRIRMFASTFVLAVVGIGSLAQLVSRGEMLANVGTLLFSGTQGTSEATGKTTAYTLAVLIADARTTWVLIPLAFVGLVAAITSRRLSVYHFAWIGAAAVLIPVMADRGTDFQHLLDLVVLTPILVGALWSAGPRAAPSPTVGLIVATVVLWGGGAAYALDLRARTVEAGATLVRPTSAVEYGLEPVLSRLSSARTVLSEDATIPVARGELPIVLDPWMLPAIERRHPEWVAALAGRIRAGEFDRIVLVNRFEETDPRFEGWYAAQLGPTVMAAIRERYEWIGQVDGFHIYGPTPTGT
jgi:hypothetical protein